MSDLKGQVAVVTGGSAGIGRAICTELSSRGAVVIIADIDEKGGLELESLLNQEYSQAKFSRLDVADSEAVKAFVNKFREEFGRIDILINNAGNTTPPKYCLDMPDEDWTNLLAVHLNGTFFCTRECGKIMKENGYGRIVVMSSDAGVFGLAGNINYAVAKTGLVGFTYTAAKELAPYGITVNALQPGIIRTAITSQALEAAEDLFVEETPVKKVGEPYDVAKAAAFLCSTDSGFINGSVLRLDGGYITMCGLDKMMMKAAQG